MNLSGGIGEGVFLRHAINSFTMAAGTTGSIAQHTIFTVTGLVYIDQIIAWCSDSLTSGGVATISLGYTGAPTTIIGATTATTIDVDELWYSNAGTNSAAAQPTADAINTIKDIYLYGADVLYNIADATLTGGVLNFAVLWTPISAGATLVAATPA